jgi:hypothetical protein
MKSSTAMFVFITGLLMTFGAVGGVENSLTDTELLSALAVSVVGLLTMYCGVLGLRNSDYYDAG